MYNNGNNNIKAFLDSLERDHLPVANTLTLWKLYIFEIDIVTVGNHIITLQGYEYFVNIHLLEYVMCGFFLSFKKFDHKFYHILF